MISPSQRFLKVNRVFDAYQDRSNFVRLDRNEDPMGWDQSDFSDWLGTLTPHDIAAYADSDILIEKLATWLNVPRDHLYVTAGSDAAIKNIFEVFIDSGQRVILQDPCWRMYEVYSKAYNAERILIPYDKDLVFDTARLIAKLQQDPVRLVALANPNQPTGTLLSNDEFSEIIAEAKKRDTLILIDEAYHLFTPQTCIDYVKKYDNVIIVRTFSKAFGLAGLRIGYCVAHPDRIRDLMLLRPVTDANSLALKCACYVLDRKDWSMKRITDVIAGRKFLFEEMVSAGIKTYHSNTNFILIKCNSVDHGHIALAECRRLGYLLKGPFNFFPLENFIRVSVGPLELMERFWSECGDSLRKCSF